MSTDQLRRLRRSKASERALGAHLIENDGPDPRLAPGAGIVSSRGRVGHITALQYDVHSKTYAAENKQVVMPALLFRWWLQICQVARNNGKEPLLRWEPSNEDAPRGIEPMIVITQARHADLLRYENLFNEKQDEGRRAAEALGFRPYSKADQLRRTGGKKKK